MKCENKDVLILIRDKRDSYKHEPKQNNWDKSTLKMM